MFQLAIVKSTTLRYIASLKFMILITTGYAMEKILIIEDSPLVQKVLSEIFCGEYELEIHGDGLTGLSAAQNGYPDLILLDIHLPEMDGYEVCRILKENDETREIPVIFITSMDSEKERVKGFESGADDYVVKPFYNKELQARVKSHLSLRKLKKQALNLERLTTFKEMAVAISHEINNPLTSIVALLHHLNAELADAPSSITAALDCISKDILRIRNITKNLAGAAKAPRTSYNKNVSMIDLHTCAERDITERNHNEKALENAYLELANRKSFFESIISNLHSGLIITDLDQKIIMTNIYVQELAGLSATDIGGMFLADFCPEIATQIIAGIKSDEIAAKFSTNEYNIGFTCIDLKDANNAITGLIINFRDLSEIVKIRAKIQQKERLTAMGEVVAGVAHEMRNPLFGMTTVGQILAMELDLSPQHRQLMDSFMHESRRLNNLVQDLLDGTRELKLRKKSVMMSRVIESATCICKKALQNKTITLKWEKPSSEPLLLADPEKLEQVLVNLIHNAIEASDHGSCIEIILESDSNIITCVVTDSGHGIPEKIMPNIFDVFFTSKKSGTGMGLSISRNIAEAHGGSLDAENLLVKGAKFTMQLPLNGDKP